MGFWSFSLLCSAVAKYSRPCIITTPCSQRAMRRLKRAATANNTAQTALGSRKYKCRRSLPAPYAYDIASLADDIILISLAGALKFWASGVAEPAYGVIRCGLFAVSSGLVICICPNQHLLCDFVGA